MLAHVPAQDQSQLASRSWLSRSSRPARCGRRPRTRTGSPASGVPWPARREIQSASRQRRIPRSRLAALRD